MQIFVEPVQSALPGKLGRGLVVTRRCVVVEAVIGADIDIALMRGMRGGELLVESRPARCDPGIELAVMREQRRLDLRRIGGIGLITVERHASSEVATHPHRQYVDDTPAEAEADGTELARGVWTRSQPFGRGDKIFSHLAAIKVGEKLRSLLVIPWISAE